MYVMASCCYEIKGKFGINKKEILKKTEKQKNKCGLVEIVGFYEASETKNNKSSVKNENKTKRNIRLTKNNKNKYLQKI